MLFYWKLPLAVQLMPDMRHIVLHSRLYLRFLFNRSPYLNLRFYSLPIMIDSQWSNPQQITINLQRPPILIINKDAYRHTLNIFYLKHTSKALLNQRPNKERLSILNIYLLCYLRQSWTTISYRIHLDLKKLSYLILITL